MKKHSGLVIWENLTLGEKHQCIVNQMTNDRGIPENIACSIAAAAMRLRLRKVLEYGKEFYGEMGLY